MASVWKAEDGLLGRTVALKVLDEALARDAPARRRFLHEAQTGATLEHASIAPVYDAGECEGFVYFALMCVQGRTLSEYAGRGPIEIPEVIRIGIAAGEALSYAHGQGVLHRDVTGRNVMVARDGRVFVLDFGLALTRDQSRLTPKDVTLGTAGYLAPEVVLRRPADARSDEYSLGVVLYEAATGTLPFRGERVEAILYATVHATLDSPSTRRADLPVELERIILRAMHRDPAMRYPSIGEMVESLRIIAPPDERVVPSEMENVQDAGFPAEPSEADAELPSPLYLAVLPFEASDVGESGSEGAADLALGLADAVAAALARTEAIHVIPPAAARGRSAEDARRLARHLGANLLLRGSVRLSRAEIRISYSLYHPYRGVQLAAQTLAGTRAELFLLEDQLVAELMQHLGRHPERRQPAIRPRPNPIARERHLQALGYLQRFDHEASVDGAIRLLEDLVATDPDDASYHATLGRAYLQKYRVTVEGLWENKAAAACHRALSLAPQSPDVLISLGELCLAAGRHREAIAGFEAVLVMRPDAAAAHRDLSRALDAAGLRHEAEKACRRAIALQPDYWAHYNQLGLVLFHDGRFAEAAETWREVTRLSPDNAMGYANLAGALFRQGRLADSVDMYRRSIELEPTSRAFSSMGTALYWLGRQEESLEAMRTCVALGPKDPLAWGTLGSAYRWIPGHEALAPGALDRAIALMRQHLERDPGRAEDWAQLASWLANRGLDREAGVAIERAIALPSFDLNCMAIAGSVCQVLGKREEALRWLREAVGRGYGVTRLEKNPALEGLRDDPEFRRILAGARLSPEGAHRSPSGNGGEP